MDNKNNKLNNIDQHNNIHIKEEKTTNTHISKKDVIKNFKKQITHYEKNIYDINLRHLASIENIKKNTEKKIKKIKNVEMENFFKKIIPIIDNLENTLTLTKKLNTKNKSLIQGIELILTSLLNVLFKFGIKVEGKINEVFNPKIHNAILMNESKNIEPNRIISISKKGFMFNNTLLRKAIVVISKK